MLEKREVDVGAFVGPGELNLIERAHSTPVVRASQQQSGRVYSGLGSGLVRMAIAIGKVFECALIGQDFPKTLARKCTVVGILVMSLAENHCHACCTPR